jgi:hypothetical protein
VLHVDTYDSIFAKPGGSFLGPDVHVDAWFGAPPSRSGRLPSGCLIADMADGSSKVIWVELEIKDRVSIHLLWSGQDRGVSGTFDVDVTADFLCAQELDIMCRGTKWWRTDTSTSPTTSSSPSSLPPTTASSAAPSPSSSRR